MKNLTATCILLLMTAHAANSFIIFDIIMDAVIYVIGKIQRDFFYEECPGVCVPVMLTFFCPKINLEGSCANRLYTARCCSAIRLINGDDRLETTTAKFISYDIPTTQSADDRIDPFSIKDNEVTASKDSSTTTTYEEKNSDLNKYSTEETSTKVNTVVTTAIPQEEPYRKCDGECVNGLLMLLCDNVDEGATCVSGTCCMTSPTKTTESTLTTHFIQKTTTNIPQMTTKKSNLNDNKETATRSDNLTTVGALNSISSDAVTISDTDDLMNTIDAGRSQS